MQLRVSISTLLVAFAASTSPMTASAQNGEQPSFTASLAGVDYGLSVCRGATPALVTLRFNVDTQGDARNLMLAIPNYEGKIEFWRANAPNSLLKVDEKTKGVTFSFCAALGWKSANDVRFVDVTTGKTSPSIRTVVEVPGK